MRIVKNIAWFLVSSRCVQALTVVHTILLVFLVLFQDPFMLHGNLASLYLFLVDLPAYIAATEALAVFTNIIPEKRVFSHDVFFGWTHVGLFFVCATLQWIIVGAIFEFIGRKLK